ncbi:Nuclear Receptor Subfamily 4 Group A Member 3 [Manis pentadactyla]|nr:Nuclear Receptor Subfamily 4 Group A Member 3 [Manis pentadactyla]
MQRTEGHNSSLQTPNCSALTWHRERPGRTHCKGEKQKLNSRSVHRLSHPKLPRLGRPGSHALSGQTAPGGMMEGFNLDRRPMSCCSDLSLSTKSPVPFLHGLSATHRNKQQCNHKRT